MARTEFRHIVLGLATTGLLAGCVEGAGPGAGTGGETTTVAPAVTRAGNGREIEAPEVFQTTDSALWDGRPSLGGIWVASPDVVDPERVVMFNPATGKSVNGALFRRERENPGPKLQVSSDAAEALGMLAGQPTEIRVTALRKPAEAAPPVAEAAPAVAEAAPADGDAAPVDAATATADAASADPATSETAALAAAALAATGAAPDAAAAAVEGATEAAVPEAPKRKTWKERRAEAKARREAEKAAKAAAEAAAAGTPPAEGTEAAEAEVAATADNATVAAVETAPLDARSPDVAAEASAATESATGTEPVPEPKKKTRRQIREEQKAAEAAAAAAAAAAAEAPAAPGTVGRTIQIASFSKEENANRAVEALAKVGVTARTQKSEQGGKVVWGVVAAGDDALLASIKDAGFADAFFLN